MKEALLRACVLVAGPCLLAGCITLGPDHEPPEPDVPDAWQDAARSELSGVLTSTEDTARWWRALGDPVLDDLIQRARAGNPGVRAAVARIDEARRLLGVTRGNRFPDIDGTGALQETRSSLRILPGIDNRETASELSATASWELDFWGRVTRSIEAASASLDASIEDWHDVVVILDAEVARSYVALRTLQRRLAFAEANLARQRETLALVEARFRAELARPLAVQQARLNLAATESAIPSLRAALRQTLNNLSALLGDTPGALTAELAAPAPIPQAPTSIAAGLPLDAVRNRPDVRRAERQLAAQTARIGIAEAALYPNFFLSGNFGYSAIGGDLFDDLNRSWGIGPVFSWNLFDGGRVRGNVAVERARTEQASAGYRAQVLEALRDTENALVAWQQERARLAALERSVEAARNSADLVRSLYRSGLTDFQNVLDSERSLFGQQDLEADSRGQVVQNLILVYRALGGGWTSARLSEDGVTLTQPPAAGTAGVSASTDPAREAPRG